MQTLSHLYPTTFDHAYEVADQIKLDLLRTHIEPSRFNGFLFDDLKAAMMFRLTFDAKPWPTKCEDLFLMYLEPSPEVSAWIASTACVLQNVEIVAILFGSDEDQKKFEKVIWPGR